MTRLVFKIVDRYGNRLAYTSQVVQLEIEGDAWLIGENPFALVGGQAAVYVKAGYQKGSTVIVRAVTPRLPQAEVRIMLQ